MSEKREKSAKRLREKKLKRSVEEGGRHAFTPHALTLHAFTRRLVTSRGGIEESSQVTLPRKRFEVGESSKSRSYEGSEEAFPYCGRPVERDRVGKGGKIYKRITWADEVGGDLLRIHRGNEDDEWTLHASGKESTRKIKENFIDDRQWSITRGELLPVGQLGGEKRLGKGGSTYEDIESTLPASGKGTNRELKENSSEDHQWSNSRGELVTVGQQGGEKRLGEGGSTNCSSLSRGSFKDVLLRKLTPICNTAKPHPPSSQTSWGSTTGGTSSRSTHPRRPLKRC